MRLGDNMPYTLAVAAAGDSDEVKKMLQKEEIRKLINTPDESGRGIPLYYACGGSKLELGHYKTIILLLEADANPLIVQPNMYLGCPPTSPLLSILLEGNLAVLRLMMWYMPDYEKVEMQSERGMLTIIERARIQESIEVDKDKGRERGVGARSFSARVKEAGDDAKKVRIFKTEVAELVAVAITYKERAEYKLVAKKYIVKPRKNMKKQQKFMKSTQN